MTKYKIMKVFDCQDMPYNVKKQFFDYSEKENDVYVEWKVNSDYHLEGLEPKLVWNWLLENGAVDQEVVIVQHWW